MRNSLFQHRGRARLTACLVAVIVLVVLVVVHRASSQPARSEASGDSSRYDWLQFGGNAQNTSNNSQETTIGPLNVASLGLLFQINLPSSADNAPVYLRAVTTPTGVHDLLFITTLQGHVVALDAHSGAQVWSKQYPAGPCVSPRLVPCITTAGPVIDPNRQFVYTYGLDGFVHKLAVGDGTEVTAGGWPELITLKTAVEKESSPLAIVTARNGTSYLYGTMAGYIDKGDEQGHVVAINLTDGSQRVFNTLCSDQTGHFVQAPGTPDCPEVRGSLWGRAGPLYDPLSDRLFLTTGNGTWDPGIHMWGDSILALHPDGTGVNGDPLDSYTPTNQAMLSNSDKDLGSANPVLLPIPLGSAFPHVAVQVSKDEIVRLINLDNLSGNGGPGFLGGELASLLLPIVPNPPFPPAIRSEPAVWTNPSDQSSWVFVSDENGLNGLQVVVGTGGTLSLVARWQIPVMGCQTCTYPDGNGNSPLVANGVLYFASPFLIQALNPIDGTVLWQDTHLQDVHWSSPIVVNGVLYVTDKATRPNLPGELLAYALSSGPPPSSPTPAPSRSPTPQKPVFLPVVSR